MRALVADIAKRRRPSSAAARGGARAARLARQAAAARAAGAAARLRLALPRDRPVRRAWACMATTIAVGRHDRRHRPRRGHARCMIVVNDATVKGGTYYPLTVKKHLRAQEIALQNNLPCIYLVDSRRRQSAQPGRGVSRTASISAASSTTRPTCRPPASRRSPASWARARRAAPMCRRCRTRRSWCRNQATIFLGGPPLVKAATGEDVSAEELGGADVHTRAVRRRRPLCRGRRACAGDRARASSKPQLGTRP